MPYELPHHVSVEEVGEKTVEDMVKDFPGFKKDRMVYIKPSNMICIENGVKYLKAMYEMKYRPDDILLMGYPKTGTNWTLENIWTMKCNPNLDNPEAHLSLNYRSMTFHLDVEFASSSMPTIPDDHPLMKRFNKLCPGKNKNDGIFVQTCEALPSPRFMKTHLPFALLHPDLLNTCKVVFTAREIEDVIQSLIFFCKTYPPCSFIGGVNEMAECIINGNDPYGPYWSMMRQAWERRHHPNLHFVFFEDMKKDPEKEIRKLDKFLGTNLSNQQIHNVVDWNSFANMKERMKKNPPATYGGLTYTKKDVSEAFFRKGTCGENEDIFDSKMKVKLQNWIYENTKDLSEDFPYKSKKIE